MRLLVIEDEARMASLLKSALARAGFAVDTVARCAEARSAFADSRYDAAILDLSLPDGDGIRLLTEVRTSGRQIPVLIVTARDAVEDRVHGLDQGADDYLTKPFAVDELVARVKALLRRPGNALGTVLKAGNVTFDTVGRDARIGGTVIRLARRESSILEYLMRRSGRVVPKAVLEGALYGMNEELDSNAIPVHVHHLRRKLVDVGATVKIHTARGLGYLLTEPKA